MIGDNGIYRDGDELERERESMELMVLVDQINFWLFIKNPSGSEDIVQ